MALPQTKGLANVPALFLVLLSVASGGCALWSSWHWEKNGASPADYERDERICKQYVYPSADGMVTQAQVRRMHLCLESKGWVKVPD